jgi:hypothetical protein
LPERRSVVAEVDLLCFRDFVIRQLDLIPVLYNLLILFSRAFKNCPGTKATSPSSNDVLLPALDDVLQFLIFCSFPASSA